MLAMVNLCEFEANLFYTVSSRTTGGTWSQKKKKPTVEVMLQL